MNAVIQHVPGKRKELLNDILKQLPGAVVVNDDGRPMNTFLKSLIAGNAGAIHFEDDAILCDRFLYWAETLIAQAPDRVISFFMRAKSKFKAIPETPTRMHMPGAGLWYTTALWIPAGAGRAIVDWYVPRMFKGEYRYILPTGFDLVIREWLMHVGANYDVVLPNIVDHAQGPSLLGPRSSHRQSPTFRRDI